MKTWTQKIFLFLGPFTTGMIFGRIIFSPKTVKHQETHSEASSTLKKEAVVQKKSVNAVQTAARGSETIVKKVYYCPTGRVKSEVQIERRFGAESLKSSAADTQRIVSNSQASSTQTSNTITQYQSNWSLGIFLPREYPLKPFDATGVSWQIGYRIIGPFYVVVQSDFMFKRPQVGAVVNL